MTSSGTVIKSLNALYSVSNNFIAFENNEKIRRALKHNYHVCL